MQLKKMNFNDKKMKLNLAVENNGKILKYSIPSKDLPVAHKSYFRIFTSMDTVKINDDKFKKIINNLKPAVGRCYSNTDMLIEAFKIEGYQIDFYSGWLILDGIPVYHAWGVCGENHEHVIDFSLSAEGIRISSQIDKDVQGWRIKYVKLIEEMNRMQLSERMTLGNVIPGTLYIGCKTDSISARELYSEILNNKEGIFFRLQTEGMNPYGATKTQKAMLGREMK